MASNTDVEAGFPVALALMVLLAVLAVVAVDGADVTWACICSSKPAERVLTYVLALLDVCSAHHCEGGQRFEWQSVLGCPAKYSARTLWCCCSAGPPF
jgi:hypothetical protein